MLTLTDNVTMLARRFAEENDKVAGLRIAVEPDGQTMSVSTTDAPGPDDQVIEQDGATVCLDPPAAAILDDKTLDAGVDDAGNVQFALGQQA